MLRNVTTVMVVLLIAVAPSVHAQSSRPQFEVAYIRMSPNQSVGRTGLLYTLPDGQLTARGMTLRALIFEAYGLKGDYGLMGDADWMNRVWWDLDAKAGGSREEVMPMFRTLLEDRFQLKIHRETREEAVFNLVVGKNGSKLKEAADDGAPGSSGHGGPDVVEMTGTRHSVEDLIRQLAAHVDRPIIDKTNLSGKFDFKLTFDPRPLVSAGSPNQSISPDIFTAIQEQLGLKLESARGPVEVLVIDSVSKPSEN